MNDSAQRPATASARDIFYAAVDLAPAERAAYVERACNGDAALAAQVQRLLAVDAGYADATLRPPPLPFAPALAALAAEGNLVGAEVGAYRLTELLGQGGMGAVYRAERVDGQIQQVVAIKFLHRDLLGPHTLQRFRLERQILATLDHPGIAKLLDVGELADGTPCFVMEYVVGASIVAWCDERRLDLAARLRLFAGVCAAVEHAHQRLIVHRDIKPGNILVDAQGQPKLLDFGIATSLDAAAGGADAAQTTTVLRFVSPASAAPEQLAGEPVGVACDVYALGNLLYELLCGSKPFDLRGLSPAQAERVIVDRPADAPSTRLDGADAIAAARAAAGTRALARQIAGDLDDIALRCLRKAPRERYASVEQLREDIDNYIQGRPVRARARGGEAAYRLRKFVGRNRAIVSIGAMAASILIAAAGLLAQQNVALTRERDRASRALAVLEQAFIAADPTQSAGADVTAKQILDGALPRIETAYADEPGLYASLASTLATVQYALHMAPQAAELAERALAAARRARADDRQLATLLILRSEALTATGRSEAAGAGLDEAAARGAGQSPRYLLARGHYLCAQGEPARAVPLLREAVASRAAASPTDSIAAELRYQLAEALRLDSKDADALQVLDATLAWQRAALPEGHPSVTLTRLGRVDLLRRTQRPVEALTEAQELAVAVDRLYGADSAFVAVAQTSLGLALRANRRDADAAVAYRTALDAWRRTLGPTHPNTIRTTYNLADVLSVDPRSWHEAEILYRSAFDLGLERHGAESELVTFFRMNLADFLRQRGRPAEALDLLLAPAADPGYRRASAGNRSAYAGVVKDSLAASDCAAKAATPPRCAAAERWLANILSESNAH